MRIGALSAGEFVIVLVLIALPMWATITALSPASYSTKQRILLLLLIWLIPFFGSVIALIIMNNEQVSDES